MRSPSLWAAGGSGIRNNWKATTMKADWRDQAFCRGMADESFATADPFHPKHDDKDSDYSLGKSICGRCEVRTECLDDAMATETGKNRVGLRGGLTPMQRAALGRKRGRGAGLAADRMAKARIALHEQGLSDNAAAEVLGIDPSSFRKWRTRHGLPANFTSGRMAVAM